MKRTPFTIIVLGLALIGCTTSHLPRGARLVGGGLKIDYRAPADGTVILRERTSGRVVATESLSEGNSFQFTTDDSVCRDVLYRMFGGTNTAEAAEMGPLPTNTFFELYFVPSGP